MKIYIIGDSISIHYGPYLQTYLAGVLEYARKDGVDEALLNLDNPQGANGGDSSMVLSFLKSKVERGGINADVLLVNCGLHDIKTNPETGKRQIALEDYAGNLRAIIQIAREIKTKLVWIRTTPCDDAIHNRGNIAFHRFAADLNLYNQAADQVMKENGIPSIDLYRFTCNLGPDPYCDHIHFHETIREKQAAYIAGWLGAYLPI